MPRCTPKQSISPRIISFSVSLRSYMLDVVAIFTVGGPDFQFGTRRHRQTRAGFARSRC